LRLAANPGIETRLIAFDVAADRYFALADTSLIRSADPLSDIGCGARAYSTSTRFAKGDIFFEPDSEPLSGRAVPAA
jgi:hypothetical protein